MVEMVKMVEIVEMVVMDAMVKLGFSWAELGNTCCLSETLLENCHFPWN